MKTTVAVFFGGRSVEHEISVISASQAMHAMNRDKYNVIPVYITKQGRWVTGDALFDVKNYRDMKALVEKCEEVYMRPEFGDFNLYRAKTKLFGGHNVYAAIDVVIPVLHGTTARTASLRACSRPSACLTPAATQCRRPTVWTR